MIKIANNLRLGDMLNMTWPVFLKIIEAIKHKKSPRNRQGRVGSGDMAECTMVSQTASSTSVGKLVSPNQAWSFFNQ